MLVVAVLGVLAMAADGPQASRAAADVVLVSAEEVIDEDLYAAGGVVTIEGVIEGDLVVWAFERLVITGTVEGDVIGFATEARITGTVGGSVRLAGVDISTAGDIGGDLFVGAWEVTAGGSIGNDLLAWSRSLAVYATVGRDVEGQTWGTATIGGSIGRDVEITVRQLRVLPQASIGQNLAFRSGEEGSIDPDATVGGAVVRRSPVSPNITVTAARLVGVFLGFLGFLSLGLAALWLMPTTIQKAVKEVQVSPAGVAREGIVALTVPVIALAGGLLILVSVPPDLALVMLAVGAPIWLGLVAVVMAAALIAPVPVMVGFGWRLTKTRWSAYATFAIFSLVLVALSFVPYLRVLGFGAVVAIGVGALVRGARQARGSPRWAALDRPKQRRRQDREKPFPQKKAQESAQKKGEKSDQ